MRAIRVQNLRIVLGGRLLLDEFSLSLDRGGRGTITGASGSGKSSLIKCLLGFLRPAAGEVEVLGRRLDAASVWRLRRQMAWVPQEPDLGQGTAREALERPFSYRVNRRLAGRLERVPELLERFLLEPGVLERPVAKLSGGEKQRVALIAALLLERPVLLLDEVSSALDPATRTAVADYLARQEGVTMLSVSHDPDKFHLGGPVVELRPPGSGHGTA